MGLLNAIRKLVDTYGIDFGMVFTTLGFAQLFFIIYLSTTPSGGILAFLFALSPIWLPLILGDFFLSTWMVYVGRMFRLSQGRTTLRIKLPAEVFKTPEAMEFVLTQVWNKQSADNLFQTYVQGKRPQEYSLEIASIGGDVRFYVNVPSRKTKDAFEAALYGQYPGVEVIEEPADYLGEITRNEDEFTTFTFHLQKSGPQFLPIKTYIDYGLDRMPKEEEKVDPLTPMLELLGTKIKPHERMVVQYIIRPWRKENLGNGQPFGDGKDWRDEAKAYIEGLMKRESRKTPDENGEQEEMTRLTPGERATIEAIERNMNKYEYETSIRYTYITKPGHFNGDIIAPMNRTFNQFDMMNRNGIGITWRTDFNYHMFSDPFGKKLPGMRKQEIKELKLRKLFPKVNTMGSRIFTTEELATLFHLPGKVALTPTLGRIQSTRGTAPANLPIAR